MPYYDFLNERNGQIKTLFFHMNDDKKFIDDAGYEWVRQYCPPQASFDTKWDSNSSSDFVEKTGKKRGGTMNDLWQKSAELSEKREKSMGQDPIKVKMHEDYKRLRKKDHPDVRKKKLKDSLNNNPNSPFTIDI